MIPGIFFKALQKKEGRSKHRTLPVVEASLAIGDRTVRTGRLFFYFYIFAKFTNEK